MSKRVTIVSINGHGIQGGVERVVAQHKEFFSRNNIPVEIISLDNYPIIKNIRSGFLKQFFFAVAASVHLWCKKLGHDSFVISNGFFAPFYCVDLLVVHGNMAAYRTALGNKKILSGSSILAVMEKIAGFTAKSIWAVSKQAKREWVSYYNTAPSKISVVNNSVNTTLFSPAIEHTPPHFYSQIPNDYVLFVGRLELGKGIEDLAKICEIMHDTHFVFISGIDNTHTMLNRSNVSIYSKIPHSDLPYFYKHAIATILPSKYEGFELITPESLACGTPVIGYGVGALKELAEDGFPGVTVVNTPDEICDKITLLNNLLRHNPDKISTLKSEIRVAVENRLAMYIYDIELKKLLDRI